MKQRAFLAILAGEITDFAFFLSYIVKGAQSGGVQFVENVDRQQEKDGI